jgi:hypothetical protein
VEYRVETRGNDALQIANFINAHGEGAALGSSKPVRSSWTGRSTLRGRNNLACCTFPRIRSSWFSPCHWTSIRLTISHCRSTDAGRSRMTHEISLG